MKKTLMYQYLGTNGTILSPVHLEDIYYVRKVELRADPGKTLTKDGIHFISSIVVAEDDVDLWKEV